MAQAAKNLRAAQQTQVWSLEKAKAPHSRILAWRLHGQRNLAGYSPLGHKETDTAEQLTHTHTQLSGIFVVKWREISFMEELGYASCYFSYLVPVTAGVLTWEPETPVQDWGRQEESAPKLPGGKDKTEKWEENLQAL